MPPNNCDPELAPADLTPGDQKCPKCGVEMEPIDAGAEGPPFQQLQLCPGCYLVMWSDADGLHVRQGVPVKPGEDPRGDSGWVAPEPKKC